MEYPEMPVVDPSNWGKSVEDLYKHAMQWTAIKDAAVKTVADIKTAITNNNKAAGIPYVHASVKDALKSKTNIAQANVLADKVVALIATASPEVVLILREEGMVQDAILMLSRQYKAQWDLTHERESGPAELEDAIAAASFADAEQRKAVDLARSIFASAVTLGNDIPMSICKLNGKGEKELNLSKSQGQRIGSNSDAAAVQVNDSFKWVVDGQEMSSGYDVVRAIYPPSQWSQSVHNNLYDRCAIDQTVEINGKSVSRPKVKGE